MALQAVRRWPSVFRQVIGAEEAVKEWEMNREVDIDGFLFDSVVPVMKTRRHEKFFKPGKAPVEIRVNESGIQVNNEDVGVHRHGTKAEHEHRNNSRAAQGEDFKEMHPGAGHPVHAPRRVMNGVESP